MTKNANELLNVCLFFLTLFCGLHNYYNYDY